MTPKVFVDTNVWFSAFYRSGNPEKIMKAHISGKIQAVISQKVLHELVVNISKKIPEAMPALQRLLESSPPEIVANPKVVAEKISVLAEKKDAPILAAANLANIEIFVTGNIKDFDVLKVERVLGIYILNPRQAVEKFGL